MKLNRNVLQTLADTRLREAEALLAAGEPSGAYYLAGYSLECALKARIASFTQLHDFPDKKKVAESFTHSLVDLIKAADLTATLHAKENSDSSFAGAWRAAVVWNEQSRYRLFSAEEAEELLSATKGVISWLKLYW